MKMHILLFFLFLVSSRVYAQMSSDWLKAGSEKQPRYFLKNYPMILCGSLESIKATIVKGHPLNSKFPEIYEIEIPSCLDAQDSLDGEPKPKYEIFEKVGSLFYIREMAKEDKMSVPVLSVPANLIATHWAMRYPQGEIMFEGPALCDHMWEWRTSNKNLDLGSWLRSKVWLPFPVKGEGETVRYHVFEYHLGCGT